MRSVGGRDETAFLRPLEILLHFLPITVPWPSRRRFDLVLLQCTTPKSNSWTCACEARPISHLAGSSLFASEGQLHYTPARRQIHLTEKPFWDHNWSGGAGTKISEVYSWHDVLEVAGISDAVWQTDPPLRSKALQLHIFCLDKSPAGELMCEYRYRFLMWNRMVEIFPDHVLSKLWLCS